MNSTLATANHEVKHLIIYRMLNFRLNPGMDMHAVRRRNLRALIEAEFGADKGAVAAYSKKYDIDEARLSQLLSESYRKGKNFGEKAARNLEEKLQLKTLSLEQLKPAAGIDLAALEGHPRRRAADFDLVSADDTDAEVGRIEYWNAKGSCGGGFLNYESLPKGHLIKEATFFRKYNLRPRDAFAIYADGHSMANFIVDGDLVIFNKAKTTPRTGEIFCIEHPDGLRIKRLRRDIDGSWILESDNLDKTRYPDERITPSQGELLKILGEFVYRQGG